MQKRRHSMLEAFLNTASGFLVSLMIGPIILPWFGFVPTFGQNVTVVTIYTAVSVVRSYLWRRAFVWLHTNGALN